MVDEDTSDGTAGSSRRPPAAGSTSSDPPVTMSPRIFGVALGYLAILVGLFVSVVVSASFRSDLPGRLGPLPTDVAWFGATGAVLSSLYGIFWHNDDWNSSYNYWHYSRLLLGAITGSIGALAYYVLLTLGSSGPVHVRDATFYVVAFVTGFADRTFLQMISAVTQVILRPATRKTGD